MTVLVTVEVGDGGMVDVLVEVGDCGMVAVKVAVGRFVGVLLGIQPPCITLPEKVSESVLVNRLSKEPSCSREAFTALYDRQVNGINRPINSASSASGINVFLFFLSSIITS